MRNIHHHQQQQQLSTVRLVPHRAQTNGTSCNGPSMDDWLMMVPLVVPAERRGCSTTLPRKDTQTDRPGSLRSRCSLKLTVSGNLRAGRSLGCVSRQRATAKKTLPPRFFFRCGGWCETQQVCHQRARHEGRCLKKQSTKNETTPCYTLLPILWTRTLIKNLKHAAKIPGTTPSHARTHTSCIAISLRRRHANQRCTENPTIMT